ncbi:MAG: hypothetical protein KAJ78_02570 [Acidobacteria bacterium]|nr:hypothetical protein [Acidobacteriota bacterium]
MAVTTESLLGSAETDSSLGGMIGVALARVVVPLYFGLGGVLKIIDASPTHLPASLIKWAGAGGVDLLYLLRLSIAGELAVVGVMVLVPRLARPIGLFLLGLFLPVLIGDLMLGASSCGCFGAVTVSPWVTLIIDGGLFVGLWYFGGKAASLQLAGKLPTLPVVVAGLWVVLSFMVGFAVGGTANGNSVRNENGASPAAELPVDGYYLPQYDSWIGRQWSDLEVSVWVEGVAPGQVEGVEYVVFYRKDCEHCHELMEAWFAGVLFAPTVAVAVPDRNGFPTENLQPFDCPECFLAELPAGIDWFFQTPVLVRLENGVVQCAAEVTAGDPQCLVF